MYSKVQCITVQGSTVESICGVKVVWSLNIEWVVRGLHKHYLLRQNHDYIGSRRWTHKLNFSYLHFNCFKIYNQISEIYRIGQCELWKHDMSKYIITIGSLRIKTLLFVSETSVTILLNCYISHISVKFIINLISGVCIRPEQAIQICNENIIFQKKLPSFIHIYFP